MNILQVKKKKKIHDQRRMIEQAKFFHSSLLKIKKKSRQKQLKSMKKSSQIYKKHDETLNMGAKTNYDDLR